MQAGGQGPGDPKPIARRSRRRGPALEPSAALPDLQPAQCLGQPARGAGVAAADLPQLVLGQPGSKTMSARDDILARVRANQPPPVAAARGAAVRRPPPDRCSSGSSAEPGADGWQVADAAEPAADLTALVRAAVSRAPKSSARPCRRWRATGTYRRRQRAGASWTTSTSAWCAPPSASPRPARCC